MGSVRGAPGTANAHVGASPPALPTTGALWLNVLNDQLEIFDGYNWRTQGDARAIPYLAATFTIPAETIYLNASVNANIVVNLPDTTLFQRGRSFIIFGNTNVVATISFRPLEIGGYIRRPNGAYENNITRGPLSSYYFIATLIGDPGSGIWLMAEVF